MKEFHRTTINPITYRNEIYAMNIAISAKLKMPGGSMTKVETALKKEGLKAIKVHCMHPNLKGKRDLHGNPYTPNVWIFTNQKK